MAASSVNPLLKIYGPYPENVRIINPFTPFPSSGGGGGTPIKLTGTPIQNNPWISELPATFDGNTTNQGQLLYGDDTSWVGLDLGSAFTITSVWFSPHNSAYALRVYGSNTSDMSDATLLVTSAIIPEHVMTEIPIPSPGLYRYVICKGAGGGAFAWFSELEVWGY